MSGIKTLHEGQRNYKCKSCEKAFAESRNHIKKIHKGQRNYKYESCEKSFAEPRNHIKIVHKGQSSYKCDSYRKSFTKSRNATLLQILLSIMNSEETHQITIRRVKEFQMRFTYLVMREKF